VQKKQGDIGRWALSSITNKYYSAWPELGVSVAGQLMTSKAITIAIGATRRRA